MLAPGTVMLLAAAHQPGFGFSSKLSYVVNKLFKIILKPIGVFAARREGPRQLGPL